MEEIEITLTAYDYERYVMSFTEQADSVSEGLKLVSESYDKYAKEYEFTEEHSSFVIEINQPEVGYFTFEVKECRDIQKAYLNAIKTFMTRIGAPMFLA